MGANNERTIKRYGLRPEFEREGKRSSTALELSPDALDWEALAVFLRLGYFVGNSTPFAGVRHTGREPWNTPPQAISRNAAIDGYRNLFRAAVRGLMSEKNVVPLSGGRDSRHILFELVAAGARPLAVTARQWSPRCDEDMSIARFLAKTLGLQHVTIAADWRKVRAEREKNLLTDFCCDEHAWLLKLGRFLHGGDAVFDGLAGDVLSAGLLLTKERLRLFEAGNLDNIANDLLGGEDVWREMLAPAIYMELSREKAIEKLKPEIAKHLDAPNPVSSFFFWNRTRREIAYFGLRLIGGAQLPYLDDAVYDHLTSLPASMFLDRTFHTETIHRQFPEYAHIPFESKKAGRLRWYFYRLSNIQANLHRLASRSKWVRGSLFLRNMPPDHVARAINLIQLEQKFPN